MNHKGLFLGIAALGTALAWAAGGVPAIPEAGNAAGVGRQGVMAQAAAPLRPGIAAATAATSHYILGPLDQYRPFYSDQPGSTGAYDFSSLKIGDVSGDGLDDLVARTSSKSTLFIRHQRPDGTLADPILLPLDPSDYIARNNGELLLGDMNEDGVLDIVVPNNLNGETHGVSVYARDGRGGYALKVTSALPSSTLTWSGGVLVDVDLDTHLDLVASVSAGQSGVHPGPPDCNVDICLERMVYFGDGKGGFARTDRTQLNIPIIGRIGVVDVNDDGLPDEVYEAEDWWESDGRSINGRVLVFPHGAVGGFAPPVVLFPVERLYEGGYVDFADWNRDGRIDVNVGTEVRLQTGLWKFPVAYTAPRGNILPSYQLPTDLDGDRRIDLVSSQFYPGTVYFLQPYLQRNGVLEPTEFEETPNSTTNPNTAGVMASGNLDADGCTDVAFASGPDGVAMFHGMNCQHLPAVADDFDGDSAADVLWRNEATGANTIWKSGRHGTLQYVQKIGNGWTVAGTGDFDGDRKVDLLLRNGVTGQNVIWKSGNAFATLPVATVADANWKVAGIGDFNADRKADILWRHARTGQNVIWKSGYSAAPIKVATVSDVAWTVAGIGDFDGDRHDDILWRHGKTGANAIWRSGNSAASVAMAALRDLAWTVAGVGDFNADGKADVAWHHATSGASSIWRSASSATVQPVVAVTNVDWRIVGVGDYDNDGSADLFWNNRSTGANAIWRAGDANRSRTAGRVGPGWRLVQ